MTVFFFLLVVGVTVAVAQNSHRASRAAWKAAGDHLRLHFTPGNLFTQPQLQGSVRGIDVRVEVARRRGGSNNATVTVYSASLHQSTAPPVVFRRQHAGSFFRSFIGGHDVVVGDPRFDDTIVVDSSEAHAVTEYLTPARRAAILSVFSGWHDVDVSQRRLSIRTRGRTRDAAEIVRTVNRLVDTARVLANPQPLDSALGHRDDGELHVAVEALHDLNAGSEANVVTRIVEAEALVATGESERAVEIIEEVAEQLPADPEIDSWRDHLAGDVPAAPSEPAETHQPQPADLSQQAVIDDLFADTRYGVAIDARYAEAFAGREVTWTGTVEQSRGYRSDADFGTDPGTKTVVAIGSVGSSRLMSNKVRAVVDLPEGATVVRGDTITFRGTLLHVDRFTRQFYVNDADTI